MKKLIKLMEERRKLLEKTIVLAQWDSPTYPEGRLRVANGKQQRRFYKVLDASDKNGEYIPKTDMAQVKALTQKRYNQLQKRQLKEAERISKERHSYREKLNPYP